MIDPSSNTYYRWLGVISFAVLYNLTMIIARSVFWKLQEDYLYVWLAFDYLSDLIYIMDTFVQFRTGEILVVVIATLVGGILVLIGALL